MENMLSILSKNIQDGNVMQYIFNQIPHVCEIENHFFYIGD